MITPRNLGSACFGSRNDRTGMECPNLVHQSHVIPLGPTPCNACLRAPREMQIRFHWGGILSFDWGEAYKLITAKSQEQI